MILDYKLLLICQKSAWPQILAISSIAIGPWIYIGIVKGYGRGGANPLSAGAFLVVVAVF